MTTQLLTVGPTSQLDAHFNGIRIEFDRLNQELDEARKQRDEYKTNYRNQERELREIIKSLLDCLSGKDQICQHCRGDITHTARLADDNNPISPPSASNEYYSPLGEKSGVPELLENTEDSEERNHDNDVREGAISAENEDPTISGITSPSLQSDSEWDIMCNGETEITLKLDLVREFTQWGSSAAAFSPDGKYLAIIHDDIVGIFDVNTGERICTMRDLYCDPDDFSFGTRLDFSPNYNYLATGDTAGEVRIWTISQRRVRNIFTAPGDINDLHFSPYGQHLVTASSDGTVRIWRLRDGFSTVLSGGQYSPLAVRFSPDGKYVASGCTGQILIWNVRTRRLVARWEGHSSSVYSLVFTPDGKGLLTGSWDMTVVCWDITWLSSSGDNAEDINSTVTEISRLVGHTGHIYYVSISPDGKWIASGSFDDKTVRIWNTDDATLQCTLRCPSAVWSVAFSPVGTYLAIGTEHEVTVWNCACITAVPPL